MFTFFISIPKKNSITTCLTEEPGRSVPNFCSALALQFCLQFEEDFADVFTYTYLNQTPNHLWKSEGHALLPLNVKP